MKLTLWRVVVVLNTHTKFRENRPFHHPYPEESLSLLGTDDVLHICPVVTHMNPVLDTNSEPGLPVANLGRENQNQNTSNSTNLAERKCSVAKRESWKIFLA